MSDKTLLIGIDAGDFRTIDELVDRGQLPTLKSLIDDGYHATLESSVPPWTPTAWTSLTSGKNPGKHGIFDFKTTDQERLVNATDVRTNRIWDYLTAAGERSIVVNVPVTHPAPDINGILIPGYLSPEIDEVDAYPNGILDELQTEISSYRIYAESESQSPDARCSEYIDLLRMRRDAIIYLCNNYQWEFAMVQFQRTDTVFHEIPEQRYIERVYSRLDDFVGDILDSVEYDAVIVASDHGMGPTGTWDFRVNTWLHEMGYLETSLDGRATGWQKPNIESTDQGSAFETVVSSLSRVGVTPRRVQELLSRGGLTDIIDQVVPTSVLKRVVQAGGEKYDPDSSIAYCPSGPGLGVYCDDAVVEEICGSLRSLTDPDSNEVFDWVSPAKEVWNGPMTGTGPDVLALPREMDYYVSATVSADAFEKTAYKYNHRCNGIFIAVGADVEDQKKRGQHSIRDVAPTILTALDVPLDIEFDGRVIEPVVNDSSRHKEQYESVQQNSYTFEDGPVESRLEDLGYME